MPIQPVKASVRVQGAAAIIDLHGEIDASGEATLNAAYAEAIAAKPALVMLNFSNVTYMNSTGIALIVGLLAQARKQKHRLVTFGLSDHYREIFEITRLSDFMTLYASEKAALAGE
jgi:anti-anti-sigma factor